jgi:hypothetical protein
MMSLLRGLHSIAAQRGDGLRPELLEMLTPSAAWSTIEKKSDIPPANGACASRDEGPEHRAPTVEIMRLPARKT